jgi:chaperone required for assembly of F1-ATPase
MEKATGVTAPEPILPMRDIFEEIFINQPLDPVEAARRSVRRTLRKRFFRAATIGPEVDGVTPVLLDGKPVRTPGRRRLAAPTSALADAIAEEWEAQREQIDPFSMPLTRLANSIIDGVVEARAAVADDVAKYLTSDLVLYRAAEPEALVARQQAAWDPVLAWMHERAGARFVLTQGVVHVAQPAGAIVAARALIPDDAWRLGAVHAMTTLTGSAVIALAVLLGRLAVDEAWAAAHVDEDWNRAQWGDDPLEAERRAFREAEMRAAGRVLNLLG